MFAEIPADAVILSRNDAARRGLWCGTGPLTVQPASLKPFRGPNGAWVMQFVFFSVLFFFFFFSSWRYPENRKYLGDGGRGGERRWKVPRGHIKKAAQPTSTAKLFFPLGRTD